MVDAVNTIGGVSVSNTAQTAVRGGAATSGVTQQATETSTSSNVASALVTKKVFSDPQTNITITAQYSNGEEVAQTPSNFVLQYLRNGYTIDGLPKQTVNA